MLTISQSDDSAHLRVLDKIGYMLKYIGGNMRLARGRELFNYNKCFLRLFQISNTISFLSSFLFGCQICEKDV